MNILGVFYILRHVGEIIRTIKALALVETISKRMNELRRAFSIFTPLKSLFKNINPMSSFAHGLDVLCKLQSILQINSFVAMNEIPDVFVCVGMCVCAC